METRTISALFDDYAQAASAVGRLEVAGIPPDDISIVGGDNHMRVANGATADHASSNAGTGATAGALLGGGAGLLAGLGLLAIPGVGPLVAAGWLATTLVGATAGAATGGIIGGLTSAGVPEEHAHVYAEGIRRGATLVTARVEPRLVDKAMGILTAEGHVNVEDRAATWRQEGWNGRYSGIGS